MEKDRLVKIIEKYRGKPGGLIYILHNIQITHGYLPENAMKLVAESTGRSFTDIYSIASFHNEFKLIPPVNNLFEAEKSSEKRNYEPDVRCPHCHHSLMVPDHAIHDHPSVQITISFGMEHGWFRFSSLYDTYEIESEYEIPHSGEVDFFCPHCNAEFIFAENCKECGAPMVPMLTRPNLITQICSCTTCKKHREKIPEKVAEPYTTSAVTS